MNLDKDTREFLRTLSGKTGWMNYWSKPELPAIWWTAGNPPPRHPEYWMNIFHSVNPRKTRLTGRRRGGNDDILNIGCLYSEHDQKDGRTLADVQALDPTPSAIIASGGGWHCYWFANRVDVTDANRAELNDLQHAWVSYTKGDPGAPDISRVLRLPGSENCKYNPPRKVEILEFDPAQVYDIRELKALIPAVEEPQGGLVISTPNLSTRTDHSFRDAEYWLHRAYEMARPGNRNRVGFWLACQLRDAGYRDSEAEKTLQKYQSEVDSRRDHYTPQEARAAVRSAYRTAAREPAKGTA